LISVLILSACSKVEEISETAVRPITWVEAHPSSFAKIVGNDPACRSHQLEF
jgi:hypothetical protein